MKFAILGCGWLGLEFGKKLKSGNHEVKGSVTRHERMAEIRQAGMVPYSIKLYEKGIQGDIGSFLSGVHTLIVDIPPGLRKDPNVNFVAKIKRLVPHIERARVNHVIFTSSTSVYKDSEKLPVYTEEAETGDSATAVQLRETELLFLNNEKFHASVVRFGGLIGNGRHPVNYLAGKKDISNPEAPVNLVHRQDCISALEKLVANPSNSSVYNLVHPEHPSKKEYYTRAAQERELEIPEFDHSKPSVGKKISSEKIIRELDFKFSQEL